MHECDSLQSDQATRSGRLDLITINILIAMLVCACMRSSICCSLCRDSVLMAIYSGQNLITGDEAFCYKLAYFSHLLLISSYSKAWLRLALLPVLTSIHYDHRSRMSTWIHTHATPALQFCMLKADTEHCHSHELISYKRFRLINFRSIQVSSTARTAQW